MPDKEIYEYAIIRLVPKVEREEFINIGVLVFSKQIDFLVMKYVINNARIHLLAPELDIELLRRYLYAWESICKGAPHGGKIGQLETPSRFRWLSASKNTIIQCSRPHSGICDDPMEIVEKLFSRYVS